MISEESQSTIPAAKAGTTLENRGGKAHPHGTSSSSAQRTMSTTHGSGKKQGGGVGMSLIWLVLFIGLTLCVMDVMYMMSALHRKEDENSPRKQHKTLDPKTRRQMALQAEKDQADRENLADASNHLFSDEHDDKKKLIDLIKKAGITYLSKDNYDTLPTWKQVTQLYGTEPKIYGLEKCEAFRTSGDAADHRVGVAGIWNSGTNLLAELLVANCQMKDRMKKFGFDNKGIQRQVPWGKHTPAGDDEFRKKHFIHPGNAKTNHIQPNDVMAMVMVRDPYRWMQSMCRNPFSSSWIKSDHCPNLVPTTEDKKKHPFLEQMHRESIKLDVKYSDETRDYDSMVDLWNKWYGEYMDEKDLFHLIVRYEDLLFFPEETTKQVCECAGGSMDKHGFSFVVEHAKYAHHGKPQALKHKHTGFVDAMIKYGAERGRYAGFMDNDLIYMSENINKDYMNDFGYKIKTVKQHKITVDVEKKEGGNGDDTEKAKV